MSAEQKAAQFALDCQGAVNLYAITNPFLGHLKAMREEGITGDALNNHPVVIAFTSKLVSLSRLNGVREIDAFNALDKMAKGEKAEYEIIPIG
jgi:hypothetical protein